MAAPRVLGNIQEFDPQVETITTYLERLELYFDANTVAGEKKMSALLYGIGPKVYGVLRSLLAPTLPQDKTYDQLASTLKGHYDPKPLVIAERFRFYKRNQSSTETIAEFLADLRRLTIRCEFDTFLEQALRDRLVCGVRNELIQKRLLAEDGLTLARAMEIAQGMEIADRNAKELHAPSNHSVTHDLLNVADKTRKKCYRCGRDHPEKECPFREASCHKCGKRGHIAPVCKSGRSGSTRHAPPPSFSNQPPPSSTFRRTHRQKKPRSSRKPATTQWVEVESSDSPEELSLFALSDASSSKPISVEMELSGKNIKMELDTGASVSIMGKQVFDSLFPELQIYPSTVALKTYTGEPMEVLGEVKVSVKYQQQPLQELPLVIVTGTGPFLLGRNWLHSIKLNWGAIKAVLPTQTSIDGLLEKYQDIFKNELGTVKPHKVNIMVDLDARPKFHRPRSVPYALKERVEEELNRLEKIGVLERVDYSEWAAPIVVVPKKDGGVRICGDYKVTVNPALDVNQYPLPKPEDLFATLAGGKNFTTLDLSHAYNQLILDESSRQYLTINTHQGLYQYTRLPFEVASAPAIFQKTMDTILQGLPRVICYIDDILVTGTIESEHLHNLERVLKRLQDHGLRANRAKCSFMSSEVQYLGHRISAEGIHPTDSKLRAIRHAPAPKNLQELRSFLGLINYYGRFMPNVSSLLHPLNNLLCKDTSWSWSTECDEAFQKAKKILLSPRVLVHHDPSLPLRLAGDASAYGVGAVISHVMPDGSERPIAFASRTLLPSEQNYAQLEKEALSLIFGINKFHTYLFGRHFTLVTDHKPLTTILSPNKGIPSMTAARLQRWAVRLSAYSYTIEFRPTQQHSNADRLSRLPLHVVSASDSASGPSIFNVKQIESLPVTAADLATATRTDAILSRVHASALSGWPSEVDNEFQPFHVRKEELTVEGGCVLWGTRVVILSKLRQKLLNELHRDHPGIIKMKSVARSYFWWPNLDRDIENLARACVECQSVKNTPPVAPLHPWVWPTKPWKRVHIDFAGSFLGAMFLVAVDAHSKWPEVFIMSSTTVSKTIEVLCVMFAPYGLPDQLVSDNGPQFVANEFATFLKQNGIKHVRSAPYHPSTNGLAERFVQSLKQSLKATRNSGRSLSHRLYDFLFTYRQSVHSTTGQTPSFLFLRREVRTRFDLLRPDQEARVLTKQAGQKEGHDLHARHRQFFLGQSVMAKNLRPGPKWIPAVIVERLGPLSYLVETADRDLWRRHVDLLKELSPAHTEPSVTVPQAAVNAEMALPPRQFSPRNARPTVEQATVTAPGDTITPESPIAGLSPTVSAPVNVPSSSVEVANTPTPAMAVSSPLMTNPGCTPKRSQVTTRSYPSRIRQPPDYLQPVWEIRV